MVGALAALAIAAARRGGRLLDTGLMLPIATSAVTIGFGMLITFDPPPVDWRARGGSCRSASAGRRAVRRPHRSCRCSAASIRACTSRGHARRVARPGLARGTVTHLRRPLVVAAGLAAAISLGEFGATSFLSRSGSETMPIAIERLLGRTGRLVAGPGIRAGDDPRRAMASWRSSLALDATGDRRSAP